MVAELVAGARGASSATMRQQCETGLGEVPTAIARLLGRDYQSPIVLEYYVSSVVQAAEGLHTALWNKRSFPADKHAARVQGCVQAIIDPALRAWAEQVLTSANGLSLRTRLVDLVERACDAGCPFLPGDTINFCKALAGYRDVVSHGRHASAEASEIYWQASGLAWVLRAIMLGRIGIEPEACVSSSLPTCIIDTLPSSLAGSQSDLYGLQ